MREILFRGKDRSSWLYGSLTLGKRSHIWVAENVIYEVFPGSIGQFTGLKDKIGKKIFEGDLVKNSTGRICEIIFHEPAGCWDCKVFKDAGDNRDFVAISYHRLEVIGNIFDNPEFLK